MAELLCLTLPIPQVEARLKLPPDQALREWCEAWQTQYPDIDETVCFLCDCITVTPPKLLILPDYVEPQNRLMVPLCPPCCSRPTLYKYGKALRLLKAMYKARSGGKKKHLHLTFNPPVTRHPW